VNAVITGIGVAAPNGLGTEEFWARTVNGQTGIRPISGFDTSAFSTKLGGEITGFVPSEHIPGRLLPQTDRMTQLALAAADWAIADAKVDLTTYDPLDMGVVTAGAAGGFEFGQRELEALWGSGPEYVSVYQSFAWFYAVNTGQLSIRHNVRGASGVVVTEQAGGLDAMAISRRHVRKGTRLLISGGLDAPLGPWAMASQLPNGRMSKSEDPSRAYLPFDGDANGYVPGEGGAILIVEDAESARARGAEKIYGQVAGYRATFDPAPGSGQASRLTSAIRGAIEDAGMTPGDIDVVFADAAGLPELDQDEADALAEVFGPSGVPVTAPKTMTGRLYSGGAALDIASGLLAIRDGVIPPTINIDRPAPQYRIDLVTAARSVPVRNVLVVARGYHGFNSALVLSEPARE
jgi:act minimal PKS chain-length factor (CLF/KS beta)